MTQETHAKPYEMTVEELAQLMLAGFERIERCLEKIEHNYATKDDLAALELKIDRKMDRKLEKLYVQINKRIDLIAERV